MTIRAARAASGARLLGDDVQHLVVCYHVLRTQLADSTIVELAVEAAQAGNVDDLTLRRSTGPDEYWQVKASVDATSPLNEGWLLDRPKGSPSLLQRLHSSWVELRPRHEQPPKVVLATTKAIDPTDIVLGARTTTDARIVETLRQGNGRLAVARKRWADHLSVDEVELIDFLECLEVRHGLSEKEWREKVQDAALGARVRADNDGLASGVQQVRDWVKAPRQTFTPAQLTATIDGLQLRFPAHPLFVAQLLEHNPRADTATYSADWTDLLTGDDPRERRSFASPEAARDRVSADLVKARKKFRAAGISEFEVDGPMRLPLWFAIGAHFCSTAGFTVSAQARDGLWVSSVAPSDQKDLQIHLPEHGFDNSLGRPWAVSVSFATDIAQDVEEYLTEAHPDAHHIRARLPAPGRVALNGLPHAQAVIFQLREELRALRRRLRPTELHLFMAMPGACALMLGHAWDRMPVTWTYWDMGQPGQYHPALQVKN
ncbi:SAVED domain-containing protein [Nocardiopsis lucentensis]|uniref:SAVED domain-containing protein n=1 Tax=Nocardiopsis lucentensis TaxID=53441 RepID=UPI000347D71E|nr:SAVED domain-containing protein [Nocardiopsis lucentensis]